MKKLYIIKLLPEERTELQAMCKCGTTAARKVTRARAFLLSDRSEHGLE